MKGFNIMTLISSTRFFNGALLAGAMALISTEVAVAQPAPGTADSSGRLVQTWDKTFPRSEKVDHQKVTFKNRYGITLAADVYLPKDRGNKKLAALVISGPFGAVKEQASGLYAQTLAERGFVTLAFDPSYTGESSGEPRNIASPDINTEDFMAAVDFMGLQPYVDRERIGVIGICGMGGIALNAVAVDKRVKAVVASTKVKLATTQPHQVIHGQSGLNLLADHRLHEIDPREPLDTIMITGRGQNPQEGMAVVDWLRLAAPHARRIVSICGGAMLLAQTGLLDGRRATTHWKLLETMQAEFPQIRVEGGPLYIQDEHIWTSGGVSSGFDLTLALVEEDYGFSLARDIAQDFVMYLRRPGGQLQFSRYNLQQTATQGPINDLLAWLLENLTADLSVDKLAEKVAMSPRNFTRVFTRETGASPARYVAEARLAAARQRLEQTHETLDRIAEQTGFGSSINLRRLFEKQLNLTPGEYRQRFHCRKMA
ncbi:helix-turn-helix domain-containing protein [Klebsiella pneumoniae]